MFPQNSLYRFVLVITVLLFAGCASNEAKQTSGKDGGVQTTATSTGTATNGAPTPPPPAATKPVVLIPNPSIVLFDKMSIKLDDKGKAVIAQLAERARAASKLLVTGFCDHRQVGNSADSAVARAVAVRDELVANGVAPDNIRVKFSTQTPKKHAAEIHFD